MALVSLAIEVGKCVVGEDYVKVMNFTLMDLSTRGDEISAVPEDHDRQHGDDDPAANQ